MNAAALLRGVGAWRCCVASVRGVGAGRRCEAFCGERCYEPEPCENGAECQYVELDPEAPCSDWGLGVWEGWCLNGTIRYRTSHSGLGSGTWYWNADTGEALAYAGTSDTNEYCDGTSLDVTKGDLVVILQCEVVEDDTTQACTGDTGL